MVRVMGKKGAFGAGGGGKQRPRSAHIKNKCTST